ncbi:hypothetical protein EV644_114156 [Kribbella orskensis]|uniref:Lipoprotein LprG n=1 Tax=Kribbella orskensis TaxID=2512216 RepID=A0ABY2BEB1_9ACTN|nr:MULTISPECIES: hypothetical protein [Kribbella]TCN35901.1 hypothetical protein EV642_115156 [Kribbella sp. VKM Ac-2500]TCO17508.1 hypothetical protein EV644_114156 [Kribbella orskensis]
MRITLPRAIALTAMLVLPVACGGADESPAVKATPSNTSPTSAELTTGTFAPRVLGALEAKGSFHVDGALVGKGQRGVADFTADVRTRAGVSDVALVTGGISVIRLGDTVYMRDDKLTGSAKRPWARLNQRSKNPAEQEALKLAKLTIGVALAHQVIGGTAYTTGFKRGGQPMIDTSGEAQEYIFTIDLGKAAANRAVGEMLNERVAKTTRKGLSVSIAIDGNDLRRRIECLFSLTTGYAANVRVTLSAFGQQVPIVAPSAGEIGEVS